MTITPRLTSTLAILLMLAPCTVRADPAKARTLALQAQQARNEIRLDDAISLARAAVTEAGSDRPSRGFALQILGLALAGADQTEEATQVAEELSRMGGAVSSMSVASSIAGARCAFDQAAELQLKIAARSPPGLNEIPTTFNLANVDLAEGRLDRAIERIEYGLGLPLPSYPGVAATIQPQLAKERSVLGIAYARAGRLAEARSKLTGGLAETTAMDLRGAEYAIAQRRGLFGAYQGLSGTILAAATLGDLATADQLRPKLREVLRLYTETPSACRAVIPDPLVAVTPGNRDALLGVVARPDRDGDGIPDDVDKCPDQPETWNGIDDDDGCPDEAPGYFAGREIRLLRDLPFKTGSDELEPGAQPALAWLATVMKGRPDVALAIEGHTDDVGAADFNQHLSESRAAAVVKALASQGASPLKMSSHGFGNRRPKILGTTPAARAANRRVEILATSGSLFVIQPSRSQATDHRPTGAAGGETAAGGGAATGGASASGQQFIGRYSDLIKGEGGDDIGFGTIDIKLKKGNYVGMYANTRSMKGAVPLKNLKIDEATGHFEVEIFDWKVQGTILHSKIQGKYFDRGDQEFELLRSR